MYLCENYLSYCAFVVNFEQQKLKKDNIIILQQYLLEKPLIKTFVLLAGAFHNISRDIQTVIVIAIFTYVQVFRGNSLITVFVKFYNLTRYAHAILENSETAMPFHSTVFENSHKLLEFN